MVCNGGVYTAPPLKRIEGDPTARTPLFGEIQNLRRICIVGSAFALCDGLQGLPKVASFVPAKRFEKILSGAIRSASGSAY